MSEEKACRWGILGTAGIARKNWMAIRHAGNGRVTAVASRSEEKARAFITECQSDAAFAVEPDALGSYEALLDREDVDAIYLPLPTGLRKPWVLEAARRGKHVLCEKPCAPTLRDLEEMVAACREAGVQFMDGVMFMHSQRLSLLREVLNGSAGPGKLRRVTSQFTFNAPESFEQDNIRAHGELEPHGCLGDLGWYCIRMTLWTLGFEMPDRVTGRSLSTLNRSDSPRAVPAQFSAELFFPSGVTAGFYCSFQTQNQQTFVISGEEGFVRMDDFVLPFYGDRAGFDVYRSSFDVTGCQFDMRAHRRREEVLEYSNNRPGSQESRLFERFGQLVLQGSRDAFWDEAALKTQAVMEACLASARAGGVETAVDKVG